MREIETDYLTIGIVPWSASIVGKVEAARTDDDEKNRLCPPVAFTGRVSDKARLAFNAMTGLALRGGAGPRRVGQRVPS